MACFCPYSAICQGDLRQSALAEPSFPPFDVEVRTVSVEYMPRPAQGLKSRSLVGDKRPQRATGSFEARPEGWLFRTTKMGNQADTLFAKGRYMNMLRTPDGKTIQNFASDEETSNWSPADYLNVGFRRKQQYGAGGNWREVFAQGWRVATQTPEEIRLSKPDGWKATVVLNPLRRSWKQISVFRGPESDIARDSWTIVESQAFAGKPFPKKVVSRRIVRSGKEDLVRIESTMEFGVPRRATGPLSFRIPEGVITQDAQLGDRGAFVQRDGRQVPVEGDYGTVAWEEREEGKRRLVLGAAGATVVGLVAGGVALYRRRRNSLRG